MDRNLQPNLPSTSLRFILFVLIGMAFIEGSAQTVIENGKLRFGNGNENSVNATGNLQQPFYYSNQHNSWRRLTFSNISLNETIAFGGNGESEWNTQGTRLSDHPLTNQIVNTSGFEYNVGSSGSGNGQIISTGTLSAEGRILEIENTYSIENSFFITIKTKITNLGSADVQNLRYWIGTRDDYVGGIDEPIKERGNIAGGNFALISNEFDQAKAIRIRTAEEGVLFFSASNRANTVVNNCCSWDNVLYQNPSSAPISVISDGSYGMFLRLNDLAPAESDEFIWYYGAASLSDLDSIINEISEAAGTLANVACNSAVYNAQSTIEGTGYLMTVPDGSVSPTAAQIKSGAPYDGVTPLSAISQAMDADVEYEFNISNLTSATTYQTYFVLEDTNNTFIDVLSADITTAGNPEIAFTSIDASCTNMNDGGLVATATNGAEPYSFQWADGPESASYGELTSGDYEVTATDANNCQATASGTVGINDVVNPIAVAKNIVVFLDDVGEAVLTGEMIDDGSSDNCELVSKSVSVSLVDCINAEAPVDLILTVEDASGNTATANASVAVIDTIKPNFLLESIELELNDEGMAYLSESMVAPYASDNCEVAEVAIQLQVFSCESLEGGATTEVLVFDNHGNSTQKTLLVSLVDSSNPEIDVKDIEIELNHDGFAVLTPEMLDMRETDNCGILSRTLSKTQFSCEDLGSSVVDITVSDFAGNTSSASFNVTVLDKMAPQIIQPEPIEMCEGILEEVSIMVSDNCSAQLEQIDGPVSGYFITQGNYELTYLATDASGNEASVSVEVVVYANPLIDLGENFQVDGAATITLVGGNDANATYVWSTGETANEITVEVTQSVSIWVQVYSEMGCMDEDEIFIELLNPLGVDELDKGGIQVYPNPSSGYLNIVPAGIDNLNGAVVRIFDMNGKTVYEQNSATFVDGQPSALNISNLSKGVYILSLQTDNFSATQRIMKQ